MNEKVYVIVLNYNGWADTIECVETVLRSDYPNYQVIIVDNNSPNNSTQYIKDWLEGKLEPWISPTNKLRELSFPPVKKPIPYTFLTEKEVKDGNIKKTDTPIIFIQAEQNRGFSAGNNIGIKYALAQNDFEYVWLLNNDTVVKKDTLSNLIECASKMDEKRSPIGTVLLYYDEPSKIQALGSKFNKFYALGTHLHVLKPLEQALKDFSMEEVDLIVGASMLLRKNFIKDVGLLDEDYFIYFEEIDLAERGKKHGYRLGMCLNSIVYHKEAVTMDSLRSEFSDFFAMRNRKLFIKKHYPYLMPILYLTYPISVLKRIKRKEFKKALNIIKIMFGKKEYGE